MADGELFEGLNGSRQEQRDRKDLGGALRGLLPGIEQIADRELPLITDIFSLVDYAIGANEALGAGGEASLRRIRDLLVQAIADVLLGDLLEPSSRDAAGRAQKRLLHALVTWLQKRRDRVALATTNYGISIEYELYRRLGRKRVGNSVDLGFEWRYGGNGTLRSRPAKPYYGLYKLHGSLDLLRCARCGHVYFNPDGAIIWQAFRRKIDHNNTCHCGFAPLRLHIVWPSMVRDVRDANLLGVWRSPRMPAAGR